MGLPTSVLSGLLVLAAAIPVGADTTIQPTRYSYQTLIPYLKANADNVAFECGPQTCEIRWTPRQGVPLTWADEKTKREQMLALLQRWRDGTITGAQKDQLLFYLVAKALGEYEM